MLYVEKKKGILVISHTIVYMPNLTNVYMFSSTKCFISDLIRKLVKTLKQALFVRCLTNLYCR